MKEVIYPHPQRVTYFHSAGLNYPNCRMREDSTCYLKNFLRVKFLDPSTSVSARVVCAAAIKTKNDRENRKIGYEAQIEGSYPVG